jgi:prolyl-tRNA editing enzyme YbaK/EbsC (Cys-tRNA(Pro) deacylase)
MPDLPPKAKIVQDWLISRGYDNQIISFPETTHTAIQAAHQVGCDVCQIAKSIVFESQSGKFLLVIVSGPNRVSEDLLSEILHEPVHKASARNTEKITGFTIGGIPPIALKTTLPVFFDSSLLDYHIIWAAAGHSNTVFCIPPKDLLSLTSAHLISLSSP